jgi:hypothetical protein
MNVIAMVADHQCSNMAGLYNPQLRPLQIHRQANGRSGWIQLVQAQLCVDPPASAVPVTQMHLAPELPALKVLAKQLESYIVSELSPYAG